LRRKQDDLKGDRQLLVERLAEVDKQIAALDTVIRIWEPDYSPTSAVAPRSEITSGFGGIADMAGLKAGSTRSRMTHMYGPAARRKRFRRIGVSGLASMYPVSDHAGTYDAHCFRGTAQQLARCFIPILG
jgi:hypothetical protein